MHPFHPYLRDGGHSLGWRIAAVVLFVAALVAIVWFGILLVRSLSNRGPGAMAFAGGATMGPPPMSMPAPRTPALDELDLRYARGDIGRDDYLGRRADLLAGAGAGWYQGAAPHGAPFAEPPASQAPQPPMPPAPPAEPPGPPAAPPDQAAT
ncbi:MAG TPA: SHOCT domain-containing protein [Candidatus Dormibacteraeota bacterium]|nr:SHOCT domain-containing protein [Candidatus Dormibacteraeota bacterium]